MNRKGKKSPVLCITVNNAERCIPFSPGLSVREILDSTDIRVCSACGGIGACGTCLVRIVSGSVNAPTGNECNRLGQNRIQAGIRLACQVRPTRDVRIIIENPAPKTNWRSIGANEYTPVVSPGPAMREKGDSLGIAIDLGTTRIRLSLWDVRGQRRLATRSGLNPQTLVGADVLTRLSAACRAVERAAEIGQATREAIGEALRDMTSRESISINKIGKIIIVGNTAMLTLLIGVNYDILLDPDNWMRGIECLPKDSRPWCQSWGLIPNTPIEIIQPLAGFVGSDLVTGVLATQLMKGPAGSLLIDFGTNSEIALWDGEVLWVTSAAGGPAFEGCGLSCGMPAEPGAIWQAMIRKASPEFAVQVIGGGEAEGLCGSGLVDIIAGLIQAGMVSRNGLLNRKAGADGLCIYPGPKNIILKKQDIDIFQRAKAAIGAGILCLVEKADLRLQDLARIAVCGAFGRFLNTSHAQAIGLLPDVSTQKIELCGNTALAGCELLLFDPERSRTLTSLKKRVRIINLSQVPEFEERFIDHLYLRPMGMA